MTNQTLALDTGLLILRLAVGFTFFYHGAQKLFGWFGGAGLTKLAPMMESMGFVPGKLHGLMAGLVEALGGVLLFLGFLTPVGSLLILSVMIVAAGTAHFKNGFNVVKGGYEYNFNLGLAALALAFMGPGQFSVDANFSVFALLGLNYDGMVYGLAALVIGVLGAAGQLAMRKTPHAAPKH